MSVPKAPADLKAKGAGRVLWADVLADLELDGWELALLRAACRACDRLEAIAEALVGAPLTVTNMKGDEVTHPLIVEERMTAAALAKTIASLRLPQGISEDGQLVRPQRRGGARQSYGIRSVS